MTIVEARKILGEKSVFLKDEGIMALIAIFDKVAEVAVNEYLTTYKQDET